MEVIDEKCIVNELEEVEGLTIKYTDDIHINQLEIIHLLKEVTERKQYILKVKRKLYKTCRHNFTRDNSAAFDDLFKWKCSKCHLYKGEFY